jgi:hypothetical protein
MKLHAKRTEIAAMQTPWIRLCRSGSVALWGERCGRFGGVVISGAFIF